MYRRDVQAYVDYAAKNDLQWLVPQTFVMWRDSLVVGDKSPNTISRMISAVKRIVAEGVKVIRLKDRLKKHSRTKITPEDMRRLCVSPDRSTLIGVRDAALLATLASSEVRASEAVTIKLSHIIKNGNGYTINICGKTDSESREAHLSVEAFKLIQEWLQVRPVPSDYIFTSFTTRAIKPVAAPVSTVTVWNVVQRYAKDCGIADIKPHDFRRFVGTQLAEKDIS